MCQDIELSNLPCRDTWPNAQQLVEMLSDDALQVRAVDAHPVQQQAAFGAPHAPVDDLCLADAIQHLEEPREHRQHQQSNPEVVKA